MDYSHPRTRANCPQYLTISLTCHYNCCNKYPWKSLSVFSRVCCPFVEASICHLFSVAKVFVTKTITCVLAICLQSALYIQLLVFTYFFECQELRSQAGQGTCEHICGWPSQGPSFNAAGLCPVSSIFSADPASREIGAKDESVFRCFLKVSFNMP